MIIGMHQPNYLPWLGSFNKIAKSDVFVFLDDMQFSKNGYCNRVRILRGGKVAWLTVPVSHSFGDAINRVATAQPDWADRHLDALKSAYSNSPSFNEVWGHIDEMYRSIPDGSLAEINRYLVEAFASKLGLSCKFAQSSEMEMGDARGDDRLVALMRLREVILIAPKWSPSKTSTAKSAKESGRFVSGLLQVWRGLVENV